MTKEEQIKAKESGQNLNVTSDSNIEINNELSVAEKEKVNVEDTANTPEVKTTEEAVIPTPEVVPTPEVKVPEFNVAPIETPVPDFNIPTPEVEIPMTPEVNIQVTQTTPDITNTQVENTNSHIDLSNSSVYKTSADVDNAAEKFMSDVRKAYEQNLSEPMKTLVDIVNRFTSWGDKVTRQGLNRSLFEEYDELRDAWNGIKSSEYAQNENDFSSNVNYGDENEPYGKYY